MSSHVERARVLMSQNRPELAVRELRLALADEPDNPVCHALLAVCLHDMQKPADALAEARAAVADGPDLPLAHYAHALALDVMDNLPAAQDAIAEAIRLDPENSSYHTCRAGLYLQQGELENAMRSADIGMNLDPANAVCAAIRSRALLLLGNHADATRAAEHALAQEPDNAYTHASAGWVMLEQGQYNQAAEHFAEALRHQPNMEWARQGMLESLKARRALYRPILRYFLWMGRPVKHRRVTVIVLVILSLQLARHISPLLALPILAFVYLSWTAKPIFNLLLRLDKFGRLVLSPDERRATDFVGGLLLTTLVSWGLAPVIPSLTLACLGGLCAAMVVPVSGTYTAPWRRKRTILGVYTLVLFLIGLSAIALLLADQRDTAVLPAVTFSFGLIAFMWFTHLDFGKDKPTEN